MAFSGLVVGVWGTGDPGSSLASNSKFRLNSGIAVSDLGFGDGVSVPALSACSLHLTLLGDMFILKCCRLTASWFSGLLFRHLLA